MEKGPGTAIPPKTDRDRKLIKDWLVPFGEWLAEAPPPTLQQVMGAAIQTARAPQAIAATPAFIDFAIYRVVQPPKP